MLTRKSVIAAKLESTIGTYETADADDAGFLVRDAVLKPVSDSEEIFVQGTSSRYKHVVGTLGAECTFGLDIEGSATSPAWAAAFLPACGFTNTTDIWSPKTGMPATGGSDPQTVSIAKYTDGRLTNMSGAMGSIKFIFEAGKVARAECSFHGVYNTTSDTALVLSTPPATQPIRCAGMTLNFNSVALTCDRIEIDIANSVYVRPDVTATGGLVYGVITDRDITITCSPEAKLVATLDSYGLWSAMTQAAMNVDITDGTRTIAFDFPKAQLVQIGEGDRDGLFTDEE